MNAAFSAAPERVALYTHRHARQQRGKALSHIVPALILLSTATATFTGQESLTWVTILEFVVGVAYLVLMVRELLHLKRHAHHERVAWLELAAAGILALEGYHIMHRHHAADLAHGTHRFHILPHLYFALAVFFAVMAFNMYRVIERRHLHLHTEGFGGRVGLLQPAFEFNWSEVESVEAVGAADVLVRCIEGREQHLSFTGLHDGPAHRDRLVAHAQQR